MQVYRSMWSNRNSSCYSCLKLCNISLVQLCECLTCCCSLSQRANSERLQSRDGVPESFLLPVEVLISSQPPSPQLQFTLMLGGFPAGRASLLLKPVWRTWKQISSLLETLIFCKFDAPTVQPGPNNLASKQTKLLLNWIFFVVGIPDILICIFNFNLFPLIEVHRVYFRIISGCVPLDCWVDRLEHSYISDNRLQTSLKHQAKTCLLHKYNVKCYI